MALFFLGVHRKELILFFIVFAGLRSIINSSHPEGEVVWGFLLDGDADALVALSNLVVHMLEADSRAVICSLLLVLLGLA